MISQDLAQHFTYTEPTEHYSSKTGCDRINQIAQMGDYLSTLINPQTMTGLLSNLVQGRGSRASDPRDKVFAVMGLRPVIRIADYTKTTSEVYTEAASSVDASEVISLLCCVEQPSAVPDLPSWVPDWSTPPRTKSLGYLGRTQGVYAAAGNPKILPSFSIKATTSQCLASFSTKSPMLATLPAQTSQKLSSLHHRLPASSPLQSPLPSKIAHPTQHTPLLSLPFQHSQPSGTPSSPAKTSRTSCVLPQSSTPQYSHSCLTPSQLAPLVSSTNPSSSEN